MYVSNVLDSLVFLFEKKFGLAGHALISNLSFPNIYTYFNIKELFSFS